MSLPVSLWRVLRAQPIGQWKPFFFSDDEADVDEESDKRKEKYLENLRNEIIEWKKLLTESRELGGSNGSGGSGGSSSSIGCENDLSQDVLKDYERILSAEQLQYVRSAVDYNKWLSESNEFRKRIAYYLAKRKYSNMLATDFEEEVLSRIEAVAARDYAENFALHHLPL